MKQIVILWTFSVMWKGHSTVIVSQPAWLRTQNWGKWVCQSYKKFGPNIALLNKPFASGESISEATAMEPPDWPKIVTKVVYMSSSFLQLAIESCNLYQPEKDVTVCKAEQLPIMTAMYFNSKLQLSSTRKNLSCPFVKLLIFANSYSFLSFR